MISIRKATVNDVKQLAIVSKKAFFIPHQHAIPEEIMDKYLKESFNEETLTKEVTQQHYEYHLIFYKEKLAGFSKIILNTENEHILAKNITKMERLYLLKEFYGLGLGKKLFDFNLGLIKKNNQVIKVNGSALIINFFNPFLKDLSISFIRLKECLIE